MTCQETSFTHAQCRIDIDLEPGSIDGRYQATIFVIEPDSHVLRPLVFRDGSRVAISGATEAVALSSALTYLEARFGGYSASPFACVPLTRLAIVGAPMVVEE